MTTPTRETSPPAQEDEGPMAIEAGEGSPVPAGGEMEVDDDRAAGPMSRSTSGQDVPPESEGGTEDGMEEAVRGVEKKVEEWCEAVAESAWEADAGQLEQLLVSSSIYRLPIPMLSTSKLPH